MVIIIAHNCFKNSESDWLFLYHSPLRNVRQNQLRTFSVILLAEKPIPATCNLTIIFILIARVSKRLKCSEILSPGCRNSGAHCCWEMNKAPVSFSLCFFKGRNVWPGFTECCEERRCALCELLKEKSLLGNKKSSSHRYEWADARGKFSQLSLLFSHRTNQTIHPLMFPGIAFINVNSLSCSEKWESGSTVCGSDSSILNGI